MDFQTKTELENYLNDFNDISNLVQSLDDYFVQIESPLMQFKNADKVGDRKLAHSASNLVTYEVNRDFGQIQTILNVVRQKLKVLGESLSDTTYLSEEVRPSEKEHKNSSSSLPTVTSKEKHISIKF